MKVGNDLEIVFFGASQFEIFVKVEKKFDPVSRAKEKLEAGSWEAGSGC